MSDGITDMYRERKKYLEGAKPSSQAIECPKHGAQSVVHIDQSGLEIMCRACYNEQMKEIIQDPDAQEKLIAYVEEGKELGVSMGTKPHGEALERLEKASEPHVVVDDELEDYRRCQMAMGAMERIHNALYPDGNMDHEWSPDTIQDVAGIVEEFFPRPLTLEECIDGALADCSSCCLDVPEDAEAVKKALLNYLEDR